MMKCSIIFVWNGIRFGAGLIKSVYDVGEYFNYILNFKQKIYQVNIS